MFFKVKKSKAKTKKADTNDGLTTQQLELIQEIMRQTQEQHRLMQVKNDFSIHTFSSNIDQLKIWRGGLRMSAGTGS